MLTVSLFGTFRVSCNEKPLTFPTLRSRALLAYLAQHPHQRQDREALAELLWSGAPGSQMRANLRTEWSRLRKVFEEVEGELFEGERDSLAYIGPTDAVDVLRFRALLEQCAHHNHTDLLDCTECAERLTAAVALHQGPLLHDMYLGDGALFDEWVLLERERSNQQAAAALQTLISYHERRQNHAQVVKFARSQLALMPWREDTHLTLMRALLLSGERHKALQHYDVMVAQLAAELDVQPSPEALLFYEQLRAGIAAPQEKIHPRLNPYRGLNSFTQQDADLYFGREKSVAQLSERLASQPLVVLVGASGSGKSSLLNAGLLPALAQADCHQWETLAPRLSPRPFLALAEALQPLLPGSEAEGLAEALQSRRTSLAEAACAVLAATTPAFADSHRPRKLLLVFDQFEELFSLCPDPHTRQSFLDLLLDGVKEPEHDRLSLILAMRSDFLGQALTYRGFGDAIAGALLPLGAMSRAEMTEAVERPGQRHGVHFEPGLVDRLLDDVGDDSGRLPLLQFTLSRLWQEQEQGWITHAAYEEMEELAGALNHYADGILARLQPEQQTLAQRIFLQLVHVMDGVENCRRLGLRGEFTPAEWTVVQRLADARLLVTDRTAGGEESVELVHEALIHDWRRLREWLDLDRAFRLWQGQVRLLVQRWDKSGGDEGVLLRGAPLAEAERWLAEREEELAPRTLAYVRASLALRDRVAAEAEAQRQRELAQVRRMAEVERQRAEAEARIGRRLRLLAAALIVAALVATVSAVYAAFQEQRALQGESQALAAADARATEVAVRMAAEEDALAAQAEAEAERIVARTEELIARASYLTANAQLAGTLQPVRRRLFAIQADALLREVDRYQPATIQVLRQAVQHPLGLPLLGHKTTVEAISFSPDGKTLASASWDGSARLWSVDALLAGSDSGGRLLEGHTDRLDKVAFHPGGRWLATGARDGAVRLWSVDDADFEPIVLQHGDKMMNLAFTADGNRLVTASWDMTVRVWDVRRLPQLPDPIVLQGHTAGLRALAISPDNRWLFTSAYDALNLLWDLNDPTGEPVTIEGHEVWADDARFTPDSKRLVTISPYSTVRVYDITRPADPVVLTGQAGRIVTLDISDDGRWLVTAGDDPEVYLWDLSDLEVPPVHLSSPSIDPSVHNHFNFDTDISPDGRWVAAGNTDGTAYIWSMDDLEMPALVLHGHTGWIKNLQFHPNSKLLATASDDSFVRLWDFQSLDAEPQLIVNKSAGRTLNTLLDPAGQWLVAAVAEGVLVRPLADLSAEPHLLPHESAIATVTFSPDGAWLGTGTAEGVGRLWATADWVSPAGRTPVTLHSPENANLPIVFSRDGRYLATKGMGTHVYLWEMDNLQQPLRHLEHPYIVTPLAFSPDNRWLAAHNNKDIWLWPLDGAESTPTVLRGHTGEVSALLFSPDNRWLLSVATLGAATDYTARLWSMDDLDAPPYTLTSSIYHGIAISPDSRKAALSSDNKKVYLWDLTDPAAEPIHLRTDGFQSTKLVFNHDSRWLAAASDAGTALWSMAHLDAEPELLRNAASNSLLPVFTPDGKSLITTGSDGIIEVWALDVDALVERGCTNLGRNFTLAEWQQYLPNQPYAATCPQWPPAQ